MRIVAGQWRGRRIEAPSGTTTRPTSDRVRESLFSMLFSRFPHVLHGASALDAFAGSGALGLEALSRGATRATFVESDASALEALRNNIAAVGATSAKVVCADMVKLAQTGGPSGGPFALLLLDPPYRIDWAQVRVLLDDLLESQVIGPDSVIVYERRAGSDIEWPPGFDSVVDRTYGGTAISIAVVTRGV